MNNLDENVDLFLNKAKKWQEEMRLLRTIVLECGLAEDFKWMHPCYAFQGKNVILIHGFKDYVALLFFKGVLLKDREGILIQQTENVQDRRQVRFTNLAEILEIQDVIKDYILEAIELEKVGTKVEFKKTSAFKMPDEFQLILEERPELNTAFQALTPGRQRGYLLYFSSPKQSKTRAARIEKQVQRILDGKGLDD